MAKLVEGHRVGKDGKLAVGCSAAVFDEHEKILLIRRADNGRSLLHTRRNNDAGNGRA